jgi:hypothetical protein
MIALIGAGGYVGTACREFLLRNQVPFFCIYRQQVTPQNPDNLATLLGLVERLLLSTVQATQASQTLMHANLISPIVFMEMRYCLG